MERFLNTIYNHISMYRMMSVALSVLWGVSIILSFFDLLPYTPLEIIVSGVVLAGVTYAVNNLFGLLFGIRQHDESGYITALILLFVLAPTLDITKLAILALIGTIAMASKYLLAYRGRHLFNPAGVAVVIASLSGLGFAHWWLATPIMTPFLVLMTFGILYKTRRFLLGLTFLGVSVVLLFISLLQYNHAAQSLVLLMSFPLLFFVGFMLTEPLTLPATKWQQVIEAVVVGALFAIPLHIGDVTLSPAFALIIGNIIAFGFTRRSSIKLKLLKRVTLTDQSYEFVFAPTKPLRYQAGQYMEITIPHEHKDGRGLRRSFSMTSSPTKPNIRFGIKFYTPSSTFKKTLLAMPDDFIVTGTTISGGFTLPKDPSVPLVFVAGGIGITPFISMLRYLKATEQKRDITLFYSVGNVDDIAYIDVLKKMDVNTILVTESNEELDSIFGTHVNTKFISEKSITKHLKNISAHKVYISGPPLMVSGVKKIFKKLGAKHIKTDYFIGY